jgi:hypothetical protein
MDNYPLAERKLIYRILHAALKKNTDLMDSEFLHDVQRSLQKQAQADGGDIADHGAWDAWLGNTATAGDVRLRKRRTFG